METTAIRSLRRLKALYTFCRAPANMWDLHELTIAKLSKEMHDKLDDMRLQHDSSNQASSHFARSHAKNHTCCECGQLSLSSFRGR